MLPPAEKDLYGERSDLNIISLPACTWVRKDDADHDITYFSA
jgi:hypothetical protein